MARLLVMTERQVELEARAGYLRDLASRRHAAHASGARFWVFEQCEHDGAFLEFIEAANEASLTSATGGLIPLAPLWREVPES